MEHTAVVNVENLQKNLTEFSVIQLLIAGFKEAIHKNNEYKKLLYRNGDIEDNIFAKFFELNNSFKQTIVLLEKLENKLEELEHIDNMALDGTGGEF